MPSASLTRRLLWSLLGVVLVAVSAAGIRSMIARPTRAPGTDLPVLGRVPEFSLVERGGGTLSAGDLRGHPWVASFIFTRCSGVCPAVSGAMAMIQAKLASRPDSRARLVSFSVDPLHDTPAVLQTYAQGFGADAARWLFVTGDRDALYRLIKEGFRLSVAELPPGQSAPEGELITHSDRLVLVDADLRIRGYYHGREPEGVARLLVDLAGLEAATP